jgi:hypothetical protein
MIDRRHGSVCAGPAPRVRRESLDPVEKALPLLLNFGQPMPPVEERLEVDLAGAQDAGPDVSVDPALRIIANRLDGLGRGIGRQSVALTPRNRPRRRPRRNASVCGDGAQLGPPGTRQPPRRLRTAHRTDHHGRVRLPAGPRAGVPAAGLDRVSDIPHRLAEGAQDEELCDHQETQCHSYGCA